MSTYGSTYSGATATGTTPGDSDQSPTDTKAAAADAAKQTAGTAKEQAGEVASTAKDKASEVAGTAKEQAQNVIGEAKAQAADLTGQLRTQASEQALSQRDRAAETLRSLSEELRGMAEQGGQNGMATSGARQLSTRTDDLAGYLENREPSDLIEDLRNVARRRPGTFLLGAAVAGLVAGRLIKGAKAAGSSDSASGQSRESVETSQPSALGSGYSTGSASDADRPQGDPLRSLPTVEAEGRDAVGERYPSTGPLADPYTRSGGSYS